jgi:hypothetical protein
VLIIESGSGFDRLFFLNVADWVFGGCDQGAASSVSRAKLRPPVGISPVDSFACRYSDDALQALYFRSLKE